MGVHCNRWARHHRQTGEPYRRSCQHRRLQSGYPKRNRL